MVLSQGATKIKISNFRYQKSVEQAALPQAPSYRGRSYSTLYNAMIHPLIPMKIRGAIWYQGEANVDRAFQYRQSFPKMIECWRKLFKQGDFPFYFVQIAPFTYGNGMSPELREAQFMTMQNVKNTGMAIVSDATENVRDIHPQDKLTPGLRLARWALAKVYGEKRLEFSGPTPKNWKSEGNRMRVRFDHAKGLMFRGEPIGWEIAGSDKKYVPAKAVIEGESVVVWSDQITDPVAVRLAWTDDGIPNLFNGDGLPTTSFRTEDWPGLTVSRKW
jgi:sialate O-acetylesterase